MRTPWSPRSPLAVLSLTAVLAVAVSGCGEERTFAAREFVDEVRAEGVELELGKKLITDRADKEVYAVELAAVAELPGADRGHTGGSMSVSDDADAADEELASCRASADLLCYRAANVVVVLEGGGIEAQQLGVAIERVAEN